MSNTNLITFLPPVDSIASLKQTLPPLEELPPPASDASIYSSSPFFVSSTMLFIISILIFLQMGHLIKNDKDPSEVLKTFGIPLIIIAAVFVVISGLDINQLTPVIGLMGTIAGYLLGRAEKGTPGQKPG